MESYPAMPVSEPALRVAPVSPLAAFPYGNRSGISLIASGERSGAVAPLAARADRCNGESASYRAISKAISKTSEKRRCYASAEGLSSPVAGWHMQADIRNAETCTLGKAT